MLKLLMLPLPVRKPMIWETEKTKRKNDEKLSTGRVIGSVFMLTVISLCLGLLLDVLFIFNSPTAQTMRLLEESGIEVPAQVTDKFKTGSCGCTTYELVYTYAAPRGDDVTPYTITEAVSQATYDTTELGATVMLLANPGKLAVAASEAKVLSYSPHFLPIFGVCLALLAFAGSTLYWLIRRRKMNQPVRVGEGPDWLTMVKYN
jgi:hypothetical protein